jgi:hypothetical protein
LPLLGVILECSDELGLSAAQMERLERLDADLVREQIRREADLKIAHLDVAGLLRPDRGDPAKPVDMTRVEAKIREAERLTADLHIALLRAIEAGKAELTPEQRRKLATILSDAPASAARGMASGPGMPGAPIGPVAVDPLPPAAAQRPAFAWYYCAPARAFYPYVQTCPEAWIIVVPRAE